MALRRPSLAAVLLLLAGCSSTAAHDTNHDAGTSIDGGQAGADAGPLDAGHTDAGNLDAGNVDAGEVDGGPVDAGNFDAGPVDAGQADAGPQDAGPPCTTTITYGANWIHGSNHPSNVDVAQGMVTWDGSCADNGSNAYATLSNGWQPYFTGNGRCVIALDYANCPGAPSACETHASYGSAWLPPANHPNYYDDVSGRLLWDGSCSNLSSGDSKATLSNGWTPTFSGADACEINLRYQACGGLYANPVVGTGCPDPGVLLDNGTYFMACTSGNANNAYPIRTSTDLVNWTLAGSIFPSASKPSWATGDFWAPEIHKVGSGYVAYFSARASDGILSVGAASASSPLGPFTDIGAPLVHLSNLGVIDASEFEDTQGNPYLLYKVDGNAVGQPTPIYAVPLSADGLSLNGSPTELITNDQSWEGNVTEGPFLVVRGGMYFLFYSGNAYYNSTYALGVARASSPLGPYTKFGPPIVSSSADWIGPGHCSVVPGPSGDDALVYHAWINGCVNTSGCDRVVLVDTLEWSTGWPRALVAPTSTSQPLP